MFGGALHVDVFNPAGADLTKQCVKLTGKVTKQYDDSARGNVLDVSGGAATKVQLPKDARRSPPLGISQPYLVLQLLVPRGQQRFTFELGVSDFSQNKRVLLLSTAFKTTVKNPHHIQIPLGPMIRGQWVNFVLDMKNMMKVGSSCRAH